MAVTLATSKAQVRPQLPATVFCPGGIAPGVEEFRYPPVKTETPFDRVVISPNGRIGKNSGVDFFVRPVNGEEYPLVRWVGSEIEVGHGSTGNDLVNVDVLELIEPTAELIIVAKRCGEGEAHIRGVAVTLWNTQAEIDLAKDEYNAVAANYPAFELPVEFLSQFAAGTPEDDSLCCPTSALMLLSFWGIKVERQTFISSSYDRDHQLYGNWSLTAAALSSFGLTAWVQKHSALEELETVVRSMRPVIISVSFATGELPHAPITQSRGHLLVVRGFDDHGNVLVNDPAGRTAASGQISYDRTALARAWLGHGGMAIHAHPVDETP